MSKDIYTPDDELEALMAELEAQNAEVAAAAAKTEPEPAPAPVPEPEPSVPAAAIVAAVEPAPWEESAPEPEPEPVAEPKPEAVILPGGGHVAAVPASAPRRNPATIAPEDNPEVGEGHAAPAPKAAPGLNFYVDAVQFRADTRLTEATLDACMIEQNGLRAYYGAQAAQAEAQASRLKVKFDVVEATLYDEHRKALALSGEKVTEKMVENAVKMDRRWSKAKNMVIEAETIAAINKNLVESLKDRKDMIVQLGADRRDEYRGATRIMEDRSERESLRERALRASQRAA